MWEEAEEAGRNARQLGALKALGRANPPGDLGPEKEHHDPPTQPRSRWSQRDSHTQPQSRGARLAVISKTC